MMEFDGSADDVSLLQVRWAYLNISVTQARYMLN